MLLTMINRLAPQGTFGTAALLFLGISQPVFAQLTDAQRAVVAFDVHVDRLTGVVVDAEKKTQAAMATGNLRRVYGAASAPASIAAFQDLKDNTNPLEFEMFFRLEFTTPEAADRASARRDDDQLETISLAGVEFIKPQSDNTSMPPNLLLRRISPTTVEGGTQAYVTLPNRSVFTNELNEAWSGMTPSDFRFAVDFKNARHLLDEAIRDVSGGVPLPAQPLVAIAQSTRVLKLQLDFAGNELMRLAIAANDEDSARRVQVTLSGMLEIVKHGMRQSLAAREDAVRVAGTSVLDNLVASVDETNVIVSVPRPEGLEKAISSLVNGMVPIGIPGVPNPPPAAIPRQFSDPSTQDAYQRGLLQGFMEAAERSK